MWTSQRVIAIPQWTLGGQVAAVAIAAQVMRALRDERQMGVVDVRQISRVIHELPQKDYTIS